MLSKETTDWIGFAKKEDFGLKLKMIKIKLIMKIILIIY